MTDLIEFPNPAYFIRKKIFEIGRGVRFIWAGCMPSPILLVETTITQGLKAADTIIEPDLKELIHKVSGKSVVKHLKEHIQAEHIKDPKGSASSKRFLFDFSEKVDMAVWWLFLLGVAYEGGVAWGKQATRLSSCNARPPAAWGFAQRPFGVFEDGPGWWPAFAWVEEEPEHGVIVSSTVFSPPFKVATIGCTFHPFPTLGVMRSYQTRIRCQQTDEVIDLFSTEFAEDLEGMIGISMAVEIPSTDQTRSYVIEAQAAGSGTVEIGAISGSLYWTNNNNRGPQTMIPGHDAHELLRKNPRLEIQGLQRINRPTMPYPHKQPVIDWPPELRKL